MHGRVHLPMNRNDRFSIHNYTDISLLMYKRKQYSKENRCNTGCEETSTTDGIND